jgi:hypothetical protein
VIYRAQQPTLNPSLGRQIPTWDMQETRELVRRRFAADQFELARQSLGSSVDRREYARYHYFAAKDLVANAIAPLHAEKRLFVAMLGAEEDDAQRKYNETIVAIGAHATACIQSLHAIADIFSHALYYSLGLNLESGGMQERSVKAQTVFERLALESCYSTLADGLKDLTSHEHHAYLGALANQSKHRSLVKPNLWIDMTAEDEPYQFKFQDFAYGGRMHPGVEMLPFLEAVFNRISKIVVDTGVKLNVVLRAKSTKSAQSKE